MKQIPQLQSIIAEVKNAVEGFTRLFEQTEESEDKDRSVEIIQSKEQKEKM